VDRRVEVSPDKLRAALWILRVKTIGGLGLAFKPLTDEIREAPSVRVIEELLKEGATVRLYDPQAMPNMRALFPEEPGRVEYCRSASEVANESHAILLVTERDEFRRVDWAKLRDAMEVPLIVDGRDFLDPAAMRDAGFEYFSVDREARQPVPTVA
jgi:UDPglucose 6-dehydrogenase